MPTDWSTITSSSVVGYTWGYEATTDEDGLISWTVYDESGAEVTTIPNGNHPSNDSGPNGLSVRHVKDAMLHDAAQRHGDGDTLGALLVVALMAAEQIEQR